MAVETSTVANGNGEVQLVRIQVTPEIAQEWLDRNPPRQRRVMDSHVRKLADEMRANRWNENVIAPIELARDSGWVLNGRHRLTAIIETGQSHWFNVVTSADEGTFDVIDAIAPRTPANVLEADGFKNARTLEAVARLMHSWLRGAAEFKTNPPRSRILDLAREHSDELQPLFPIAEKASRQTIVQLSGGRTRNPMPKALAAFCAFLEGDGLELMGRLADWPEEDIYNHDDDAVSLFRTALTKRATKDVSKRATISLFVMAKNLDHTGAPLPPKGLIYKSASAFPVPEWPTTLAWGADHNDADDDDD